MYLCQCWHDWTRKTHDSFIYSDSQDYVLAQLVFLELVIYALQCQESCKGSSQALHVRNGSSRMHSVESAFNG